MITGKCAIDRLVITDVRLQFVHEKVDIGWQTSVLAEWAGEWRVGDLPTGRFVVPDHVLPPGVMKDAADELLRALELSVRQGPLFTDTDHADDGGFVPGLFGKE